MKVVLVRQSPLKLVSWFEKNKGKIFDVIQKHEWGYDVDLGPCGHPGITGYMSHTEVVEVYETSKNILLQDLIYDVCGNQQDAFIAFVEKGEDINNFAAHIVGCKKCRVAVEEMFEEQKEAFERIARDLHKQH